MTCFGHKFLNRCVQFFTPDILMANDSFCIDQISSWPTCDIPFCCDRPPSASFAVPKTAPVDIQILNRFTRDFDFVVAVNSNQSKWFISQLLYERPLVWDQGPARTSPLAPKANQHNVALVVAQFKIDTIQIRSNNIRNGVTGY